jgi:effector-binding domain-containing protein
MKTLKKIILVFVAIVALAAVIGMFMSSHAHIERSMVLKAPAENIFYQVNELKNWNNWMPFNKMDKNMKITWGAKTEGEGASYSWESTNSSVGKGSITITKVVPQESVATMLHFEGMSDANSLYKLEKSDSGTKVVWAFDGDMGSNPFKRLMRPIMEKGLSSIFDRGLRELDSSAKVNPAPTSSNLQIAMTTVQPFHYMAIRDTATASTIGQKLGMNYELIGAAMQKQNLKMAGPVMAIYYTPPPNFEFDAAAHVDKPGKDDGKVKAGEIKGGNAVVAHYYGAYEKIPNAWTAIKQYIADNKKVKTGAPWEEYVTDPMMEKDTAKWLTNIYFPVE